MGSEADLHGQLLAVQGTPTAAVVRVASAERLRVGRTLDAGADGLMIPRLETVAEIAETLTWMRYPPDGIRGVALGTRGGGYAEIAHGALATTVNDRVLGCSRWSRGPRSRRRRRPRRSTASTSCSSARPTCRTRWAMPGRFDEPSLRRRARPRGRHRPGARQGGGILLRDASGAAAAVAQGFGFIGIGSDSSFLVAGAASRPGPGARGGRRQRSPTPT